MLRRIALTLVSSVALYTVAAVVSATPADTSTPDSQQVLAGRSGYIVASS